MALVTCEEMKALEEVAFARGVVPEDLMDLAGTRLGRFVDCFFPETGTAIAYLGKGNNGGDALVALQHLRDHGWSVLVRSCFNPEDLGQLPQKKLRTLELPIFAEPLEKVWDLPKPLVLLDGLVGIGASGALREPLASLAEEMNWLRQAQGARTVAIDLPSGMNGDTGEVYEPTVTADVTCTLAVGKSGLVADTATEFVGRIELLPLEELSMPEGGNEGLITSSFLRKYFSPRAFNAYKGSVGSVALLAGSSAYVGAAVLAAIGALKGGAGLVTLYIDKDLFSMVRAAGLPAEVIVRDRKFFEERSGQNYDALVIGPGLGELQEEEEVRLLEILREWTLPSVIDADALNLVARKQAWDVVGSHSLLTPHPGEMKRLLGSENELGRRGKAQSLAEVSGATVLYKGARTVVAKAEGPFFYNTTGTPGMATGGQGDLLSGLLGALLAGGLLPFPAACSGAWLCGRAAEIGLSDDGQSEESLLPTEVAAAFGRAFKELRGQF